MMASFRTPQSGLKDETASATDVDTSFEQSVMEGQELQWIGSGDEDTDGESIVTATESKSRKRFSSLFRKSRKTNDLMSRIVVLPPTHGGCVETRNPHDDWDKQHPVNHPALVVSNLANDEAIPPAEDDHSCKVEDIASYEGAGVERKRLFRRSKKDRTSARGEDIAGAAIAAGGTIAILPTKNKTKKKNKKKKTNEKSVQYFKAQVITNKDDESEVSNASSDVRSVRAYEDVNEKLKNIDDASLDSLGAIYCPPISPPRDEREVTQSESSNRPTFVDAPKLDARVLTADSWSSLLSGDSLANLMSRVDEAEEEELEPRIFPASDPRETSTTRSLDGSFIGKQAKSVKKRLGAIRRRGSKKTLGVIRRRGKKSEVTDPAVWIHVKSDGGDEEIEAQPPVVWAISRPMSLNEGADFDDDDRSALTMDEALTCMVDAYG